jgi:hypothetical protein
MLSPMSNHKYPNVDNELLELFSEEDVVAMMSSNVYKPHQRPLFGQAPSRKSTWRICGRLVCFGGESRCAFRSRAEDTLEFAHY